LTAFKTRATELGQSIWVIGEVHTGDGIQVR